MRIVLTIWIMFAVALASQLILWRFRLPQYPHQMKVLLLIFGAVFGPWLISPFARSASAVELLNLAFSHISLSLGYIVIYSAINVDSPALSLKRFLAEKRAEGRSAGEIDNFPQPSHSWEEKSD